MGQKVNPHGLRVGVIKDWDSRWYARNEKVGDLLVEDKKIRDYLKKTLYSAGIPKIEIERDNAKVRIYLHCARPGVVIGKGGEAIEALRLKLEKMLAAKNVGIAYREDLADRIWSDRPSLPCHPVMVPDEDIFGETVGEKLARVREKMAKLGAKGYFLSKLDDLMWLFNIRGRDFYLSTLTPRKKEKPCNPAGLQGFSI